MESSPDCLLSYDVLSSDWNLPRAGFKEFRQVKSHIPHHLYISSNYNQPVSEPITEHKLIPPTRKFHTMTNDQSSSPDSKPKKSLYQRYWEAKHGRNKTISDEDLVKYTGKTRAEIIEWGKTAPGVAGNQPAGKISMGPASGLGGYEASQGYGGWGFDAEQKMKFPPKGGAQAQAQAEEKEKKLDEEESD